jgi:hypothetical protein
MKKFSAFLAVPLAMALVFALALAACDNGTTGGGPLALGSVSYESSKGDTSYKLTITQSKARDVYSPASGDTYLLLITKGKETKTSIGIVQSAVNGTLKLKPESSTATFSVLINSGGITSIYGTITTGTGETVQAPGSFTSGDYKTGTTKSPGNSGPGRDYPGSGGPVTNPDLPPAPGYNTVPKTITITGLTGRTGDAFIYLMPVLNYGAGMATGTISDDEVTFSLDVYYDNPWAERGQFIIEIFFYDAPYDQRYPLWYTNGKTKAELKLSTYFSMAEFNAKLPKFNLTSESSTIDIDKFFGFLDNPYTNGWDYNTKTITITGLTGQTGDAELCIGRLPDDYPYDPPFFDSLTATISDDEVAFTLYVHGIHTLDISFDDGSCYVFTDDKTLAALDLTPSSSERDFNFKLPMYNFPYESATLEIPFSDFRNKAGL